MSYEPTVWKDGDLVTSAKLNKLEQGVANSILIVHAEIESDVPTRLDKTWQEIYDAPISIILADYSYNEHPEFMKFFVYSSYEDIEEGSYKIEAATFTSTTVETITFVAQSPNDYLVRQQDNEGSNGGNLYEL